jgi:hypothetical protein
MSVPATQDSSTKKKYRSPELIVYGNILVLTRALGQFGQLDGGGGGGNMMGRTA